VVAFNKSVIAQTM